MATKKNFAIKNKSVKKITYTMKQRFPILTLTLAFFIITSCEPVQDKKNGEQAQTTYKPIEALKEPSRLEKLGLTEKQVRFSDDTPEAQGWIVPAAQMLNQGSFQSAIETIDKYIAIRPDRPVAYLLKGYAQSETGDYAGALQSINKVLTFTPENTHARMLKGICHLKLEQLPESYAAFGMVIRDDPKNMLAYYNRGQVLAFMKKYKEALSDFDEAIRIRPDYAPAFNNRGNVKFLAGDKEGACDDWKRSMEMGNTASEKSFLAHCRNK